MRTHKLGSSDMVVPIACLGTMCGAEHSARPPPPPRCSLAAAPPLVRRRRSHGLLLLPAHRPPPLRTFGEQNTEEEAFAQLDLALARGVNWIDTAELYPVPPRRETSTATESIIGRWMAARGCRERVLIATKVAGPIPGLDRSYIVANRRVCRPRRLRCFEWWGDGRARAERASGCGLKRQPRRHRHHAAPSLRRHTREQVVAAG
jgi:aryl-alcohol dehydrogenase-like predicted oxidoreductase